MQWKDYISAIAAKGVTQNQIAKEAGCGQATISDLASGKTKEPRASLGMRLVRIGRRHGVRTQPIPTTKPQETATASATSQEA